jgi:zinc protease
MPICNPVRRAAPAVLVVFLLIAPARAADRQPQIPELKVERFTLKNGLQVLMLEDHTTPVVALNVWYRVGSKNEDRGRTGLAHLVEHLMFQGSEHHDREYHAPLEKLGAQVNARTSIESTMYLETLPSCGLEPALWLESDRMGFLLPALTQHELDRVRDVVKNEHRQRVESVPYVQSTEDMIEALSSPNEPNGHSAAGSMADLSAATLADVSAFLRTYYTPNNASLAIAGDFKPHEAKRLVEKYFGPLPAGPKVPHLRPNRLRAELSRYVARTEQVPFARTQIVWPTVEAGHADQQALRILAAVLGRLPRENRLYRALIVDAQSAVAASASSRHFQGKGDFVVTISARSGQSLDPLVVIADAQIERLKADGPTEDEVRKVQNSYEASFIRSLESVTRLAALLNANNAEFGDPTSYAGRLRKLFAVTPDDVKAVARKYLTGARVRLDINPGTVTTRAAERVVDRSASPASRRSARPSTPKATAPLVDPNGNQDASSGAAPLANSGAFDRSKMPEIGSNPPFTPPPVVRRKLSNGLEILIAERHQLPTLTLWLICRGGDNVAPPGKEGLSGMTAHLMREGTTSRDAMKLAGELSEIGAILSSNGGLEWTSLSLSTLTRYEAKALDLFADVLLHPSFPKQDLARIRTQRLAALSRRRNDASAIAGFVFPKLLYGSSHPYGRTETISSVAALARDDAIHFYEKVFLPNNAALIAAGDTTPDAITAKLEEALKGWKSGEPPQWKYPDPPSPKSTTVYLVDRPAAVQSVLAVGHVGVPRNTPDFFSLLVTNGALGGQFSSRINLNLREERGFAYGAGSGFFFRAGPGPFAASALVETTNTKPALVELLREIKDITGSRPITDDELAFAKDRLIKIFPARFETTSGQAGALSELAAFRLADDYFTTYQSKIEAVSGQDVASVARKYIDFDHLTILVVGDRKVIEAELKELSSSQVVHVLDRDGNPPTDLGADQAGAGSGAR